MHFTQIATLFKESIDKLQFNGTMFYANYMLNVNEILNYVFIL